MGKETDILYELIDIWAKQNQFYSLQGTVESVDGRTCVIKPNDGGPDLNDVSLEADYEEAESKGFFIVPAIGSNVIVTFKSKDYGFLSAWTEISQVVAKQGEWIFNDGENGGLTITPELKSQLDTSNKLIQALIDVISGTPINEPGNGAPSALQIALAAAITGKNLGDYSDIENEDVKH